MKNVLIYLNESALEPKGGPNAVGFYIHNVLKHKGINNISFIKDNILLRKKSNIKRTVLYMQQIVRIIKRYKRFSKAFSNGGYSSIDLNQYDIVHFHKTIDMYENRKSLENYKGKVILTSHSPVPLSREFYDEYLTPFERKFMQKFYSQLIKMDEYAFNRADIIHFPCEEAEEPYYNNWLDYKRISKERKSHYVYIPTGIPQAKPKRNRQEVREELHISNEDFCISYVGRHNYVKGYDKLKEIGEMVLEDEHTWIIVAGKEEPLFGLEHEHWKEIGWTNDAHSYISASDVFVLPNKETYFDIVMLEVLSLGKIVVASRTGGNRYFDKLKPNGVFLYNTIEEVISIINKLRNMSMHERNKLGELNKKMFLENFTDEVFVNRYCEFINNI